MLALVVAAIVMSVSVLTLVNGTVLPIVVGVVTKYVASSRLKAIVLLALSIASGVIVSAVDVGGIITNDALISAAVTWVTAVATYYGLWKPTGLAEKAASKTANFGIGKG